MSKHLREVRRQMYKNLWAAYQGKKLWNNLCVKYRISRKTAVLLMPSLERGVNSLALLYLDKMLEERGYTDAIILTYDFVILKCAKLFSENIKEAVSFSRKLAERLMQFYCLMKFDERLIIASLDEPNGRNGRKLVGQRDTTVEELFLIGVYKLYPYEPAVMPEYGGEDPEILEFLKDIQ